MTHNVFDIEEDFARPLSNFLNYLYLSLRAEKHVELDVSHLIYPDDSIIDFERSKFKTDSFVWRKATEFRRTEPKPVKADRSC